MGRAYDPRDVFLPKALTYLKMQLGPSRYNATIEARCRAFIAGTEPVNLQEKFETWMADYFGSIVIVSPAKVEMDVTKGLEEKRPYENPRRKEIFVERNIAVIRDNPHLSLELADVTNPNKRYWRRNH